MAAELLEAKGSCGTAERKMEKEDEASGCSTEE